MFERHALDLAALTQWHWRLAGDRKTY
ncbi:hypothetical protein AvCA_37910 [Azotobacter vinelandii CA]|uniref:Uncharacterized protein n=2 Tax=Azotobacter vinelandii TaxID=354 RepID=C1DS60_AZOVD|nr:hypothetical protein Avin_37910 [Azotobacter vinelandii DJ]AGK16157.1 hypothetical protein AvCA_37910 [Azotobacter vinelandii CA]AGK21608.1 hypothetical protein AvCA6_37910 [Azotobacter vinelandii CA6]